MPSTLTDRLQGTTTSVAVKAPCAYVTTANITLSGLAVQAGGPWLAPLADKTRILVVEQTNAVDNGIWVAGAGTWQRARDFNGQFDVVQGTMVLVGPEDGARRFWGVLTENPIIIGTSEIEFEPFDPTEEQLRIDLANAAAANLGAGLIGYNYSLAYEENTVGRRLQESLSLVEDFGASGDGVTDDTATILIALQYCSTNRRRLYVPGGRDYLMTELTLSASAYYVDMYSDAGSRARFVTTGAAAAAGARQFEFVGAATVTGLALAAEIKPNEREIFLADTAGLSVGMVIRLTSNDTLWPYDNRGVYYKGELHEIIAIDSGTDAVTIRDSTRDSYGASESMTIDAWVPSTLALENLEFVMPDGASTGGVFFTHAINAVIKNCRSYGSTFYQFLNRFCINNCYRDISVGPAPGAGAENGYGISDRSSLGTRIDGFVSEGLRAAYDSHSSSGNVSVPNRDAIVANFVIRGGGSFYPDGATESRGLGMHGPSENIRWENGIIADVLQAFRIRGKSTYINNVTLSGLVPVGAACTHGTGLTLQGITYDAFNHPNKGIVFGDEVAGSGMQRFVDFGITTAAANQWDYSLPTVVQSCILMGVVGSVVQFTGGNAAMNVQVRNNTVVFNPGAGNTGSLLYRESGSVEVVKSCIADNSVQVDTGTFEFASSTLVVGGPSSETHPAVQVGSRNWIIRLADDTVGRIFLGLLLTDQDRPFLSLNADAGGAAIFQMRKEDATLTILSGTFSSLAVTATPTSLNGTGGVDGNVTLGLTTEGELYIENRSGAIRTYRLTVIS